MLLAQVIGFQVWIPFGGKRCVMYVDDRACTRRSQSRRQNRLDLIIFDIVAAAENAELNSSLEPGGWHTCFSIQTRFPAQAPIPAQAPLPAHAGGPID